MPKKPIPHRIKKFNMLVRDVMQSEKIHTVSGDATVREAAVKMAELNIGALVVGKPDKIEGLFSERDILKRVVGKGLAVESTKIKDVMSTDIILIDEFEMAFIALKIMQKKKFRHLPVVNEQGFCVGMLGFRDLMTNLSDTIIRENLDMLRQII